MEKLFWDCYFGKPYSSSESAKSNQEPKGEPWTPVSGIEGMQHAILHFQEVWSESLPRSLRVSGIPGFSSDPAALGVGAIWHISSSVSYRTKSIWRGIIFCYNENIFITWSYAILEEVFIFTLVCPSALSMQVITLLITVCSVSF